MKTKSLRKILCRYGTTMAACAGLCFGITMPIHDYVCTKTNRLIGFSVSLVIFALLISVILWVLNKTLISAYNEKLSQDAYNLAVQLKGNSNVDTDVLKELLIEIRVK